MLNLLQANGLLQLPDESRFQRWPWSFGLQPRAVALMTEGLPKAKNAHWKAEMVGVTPFRPPLRAVDLLV